MEKFGIEIFESINFRERYKSLSDKTRISEAHLEKVDKKMVTDIFESFGYTAKYFSKESFYRIEDTIECWSFNIRFSLKYGVVEIILGFKNNKNSEYYGGPSSVICEDIDYSRGIKTESLIKKPSFDNYRTLEKIFKEALSMYEDMKKKVLSNNMS
ncbi:MAG: hypothetical protein WDZ35_13895 [Crocinitomicaceae bacterium]